MKILVFSDSHGKSTMMNDVIKKIYDEIQLVLFLGDCIDDFEDFQYIYDGKQFLCVRGNCDFSQNVPDERVVSVADKKIFMSHGHRYRVKADRELILSEARKHGADICLYGHSHAPENVFRDGIYLMNPGSISQPRGVKHPSYGVIDIADAKIDVKIVEVKV